MDEIPITVPEGLPDLMKQYVVTVLRQKPDDLLKHAAEYFTRLHVRVKFLRALIETVSSESTRGG